MWERKEMEILAVNQVAKNFDKVGILELSYAVTVANEGRDQVFKYKFCKKVASKIAMIDPEDKHDLSFRCMLISMFNINNSEHFGAEWWDVLISLANQLSNESRKWLSLNEIYSAMVIVTRKNITSDTFVNTILGDLVEQLGNGAPRYEDLYDLITVLYASKLQLSQLIGVMLDYYVQKGYDEDELALLGPAKACKLFKAIWESSPGYSTAHSDLFLGYWLNYISNHFENEEFTKIQA